MDHVFFGCCLIVHHKMFVRGRVHNNGFEGFWRYTQKKYLHDMVILKYHAQLSNFRYLLYAQLFYDVESCFGIIQHNIYLNKDSIM